MTFPILGGNGAIAGAFSINNSLRFNSGDSPILARNPSSAGDGQKFTYSTWFKRSEFGVEMSPFLHSGSNASNYFRLNLSSGDAISSFSISGGSTDFEYVTTQVFRDPSAWYHLVFAVDTTNGTAANRVRFYINGSEITSFSTESNPSQNLSTDVNGTTTHYIGRRTPGNDSFYDGYLTETHLVDGSQLAPTDFGEYDEDSGIWKPIRYSGSYGTNGYKLNFSDSGSLGADSSGNGNDFTPTNLTSTDQTTDTPTNNFSTFNSLITKSGTLSEGNLKSTGDGSGPSDNSISTMGVNTGKWYAEFELTADGEISGTTNAGFGICDEQSDFFDAGNNFQTSTSNAIGLKDNSNMYRYGTENASWGSSFTENDILQIALDMDNGYVYFGKNGTFMNSGVPTSGSSGTGGISITNTDRKYFMFVGESYFYATPIWSSNFGNPSFSITSGNSDDNGYGNFEYAPPSGYLALCTQNLATELSPTIDDGSDYFNTVLYTGNGSSQSITGVGFSPDFLWLKERSSTSHHQLFHDADGGVPKFMQSSSNIAEVQNSAVVSSFDSDGFSVGSSGGSNQSGETYVGWNWYTGASYGSNTDGSITSTVSANTTAGFSIVTYTGNATNGTTVGHGLGKVPSMVVTKARTDSPSHWRTYHTGLTDYTYAVSLNSTDAEFTGSGLHAVPTSSVFALTNSSQRNQNTINYVAYCFADIEGYSKFGSYTGNGSTDGPFVYTGFKPAWLMIKNVEQAGGQWFIHDNKRETFNPSNSSLFAESSQAETANNSALDIDFLSNGWKKRNTGSGANNDGIKYIYMAFAENPFATSGGVPVTAR
jgi:hypothetical protein